MPRTHAPIFAAVLGVGLVLAATRAPEATVMPSLQASVLSEVRVAPAEVQAPAEDEVEARDEAEVERDEAALAIELPEVLASFVVPRDRLMLSAATHTPGKAPFVAEGASVVALVASWCAPCAAELPRLTALAEQTGARLVFVSLDDVAGPESLAAVIEDLFARAEPSSRVMPAAELRADPDGAWTDATAPLLVDRGDPGALPQTLVFAGGRLVMLVQGALDEAVAARSVVHLEAAEVCR